MKLLFCSLIILSSIFSLAQPTPDTSYSGRVAYINKSNDLNFKTYGNSSYYEGKDSCYTIRIVFTKEFWKQWGSALVSKKGMANEYVKTYTPLMASQGFNKLIIDLDGTVIQKELPKPSPQIKRITVSKGCDITKKADKFKDKVIFYTSFDLLMQAEKVYQDKDTLYYLILHVPGQTLTVRGKGVIILLSDSTKMKFLDADIDEKVNENGDGYTYNAFIGLHPNELKRLSTVKITAFQLYIYDTDISSENQDLFLQNFNCLIEAK